jgi:stage II sporulation protein D
LDLDGNFLIPPKKILKFLQILSADMVRWWKVIFLFILLILWSSCAKKVITPVTVLPPKIPAIRVSLTDSLSQGTLFFINPYQLPLEEANYILDSTLGNFQVSWDQRVLTFRSDFRYFSFEQFERIEFIPLEAGEFNWQGIPYKGKIAFVKNGQSVIVINELLLPDYLQGVVPHEIPSHSEEYYQAVVSQAIAAATYAYYSIKNPASAFFDLYNDQRDQIYQGTRIKTPLVDKAVAESMGIFLQNSSGQLVKVQYHSTCGGMIDYLPINPDSQQKLTTIQDHSGASDHCELSPLYRWVKQMTAQDLLDNLMSMGLITAGQELDWKNQGFTLQLEILSRKSSGRVEKLKVKLPDQEILLNEWQIRRFLADKNGNPQASSLFILKISPKNPDQFYVIGAGYGHGRGMCQWGAIGQALHGKSYQEILNFYYPELHLKKLY